jgi:signal transduction histidine kinase
LRKAQLRFPLNARLRQCEDSHRATQLGVVRQFGVTTHGAQTIGGLLETGCEADAGQIRIWVADNGVGIEERYFARVFELFETLAPRDEVEGTGVGLALVKKIVESGGGRVWLESTRGAGTTVHFSWPRTRDPAPATL